MTITNLRHLQIMFARLDNLIRDAVLQAEAAGRNPEDALRGLVITPEDARQDLAQPALTSLWMPDNALNWELVAPPRDGVYSRFWFVVETYGLDPLDAAILLVCLAPAVDSRYERLYAFLQDNIAQRRPTVTLAMNLLGGTVEQRYAVWLRLQHHMPLRDHHLLITLPVPGQPNHTFLRHILAVDERMVGFLLGDDTPDRELAHLAQPVDTTAAQPVLPADQLRPVLAALAGAPLVYMRGSGEVGQQATAAALCREAGLPLLRIAGDALVAVDTEHSWARALREGYLGGTALLITGWDAVLGEQYVTPPGVWQRILDYPRPVFLVGNLEWEPPDIGRTRPMLRLNFEMPAYPQRLATWQAFVSSTEALIDPQDMEALASQFRFTYNQIARAVHGAVDRALTRGERPNRADLYASAQAQVALRFGRLAQRIEPRACWDYLVLPQDQTTQLQEILERAQHTHMVQSEWGFGERLGSLAGVSALFAGESGTGKTLSAQIIARELALPLYKIDLSGVVSKYIGETEKNLHTIFEEARSSSAILFFDEADALFGKRSEVKDARDRYANIEIAYLLQKIEEYDGIAIMASNLRQNIDEAFTRRLDFLVDFPFPDVDDRQRIWRVHFPPEAPLDPAVDLQLLAERYRLAGGNIRNAVVAAAYLAAADSGVISMAHIHHAVRREYQKMGRLLEH